MNRTVSQRITLGFTILLVLLGALAAIGAWALTRTARSYDGALLRERTVLSEALAAQGELRAASIAYLRFLVERSESQVQVSQASSDRARDILAQLARVDTAGTVDDLPWDNALTRLASWRQLVDQSIEADRKGDSTNALRLRSEAATQRMALDSLIDSGVADTRIATDQATMAARTDARAARTTLFFGFLLTIAVGVFLAWRLIRVIREPLQQTSGGLASSAAEILAVATQQAASANETMAAVSQTVATVDEVSQTSEQASQRARAVAESAQRAAEIARNGRQSVENSIQAMDSVRQRVESIADSILALAEQAQAIGEIITAVNDIAEQTNLLALNAAVEATRAGENGRGFAVVASEIKSLAEQAKRSTVEIRQILNEIQRATSGAVMATEQGTKQATAGSRQASEAGETIRALSEAVTHAAQAAAQIVASAGQQAIGMEQIRQAIGSIHEATQQNLTSSKQAETAATELNRLGSVLIEMVGERGEVQHSARQGYRTRRTE